MNKLTWYINRFSLMSPLEIVYRIKEELKKIIEKKSAKCLKIVGPLNDKDVNFFLDLRYNKKIFSFVKEKGCWNKDMTKMLLEYKFSFFSFDKRFLGNDINWHYDYKNNIRAPLIYSKDINYRDFKQVGDIKYIWELNRHQHLITLAKAYYLTGNEDYKNEVERQIKSWIDSNPYLKGVNWLSALELGVRLISWSWIWFFLKEIERDFKRRWLECIYKHCKFISSNFSHYSSSNNHLIGEAAGLFIASIVWPFSKESKKWQEKSLKILIEEIEKQNYKDGVNKEQAISYQQFVMDFFILAGLLGEKNGKEFPRSYWKKIELMCEYIASIMDCNGNVPNIGDSDDGYAVILSEHSEFNPYKSLLSTGAVLFNRGDFKTKAGNFDEKSFWLLGPEGVAKFDDLESYIEIKTPFDKGGYYILQKGDSCKDEIKMVFDCGALGYLSIAAHGHADALSFTLNAFGKEFFIDPGTYTYFTNKEWRDYFRGTSAHNTIRIDGLDQSVIGGDFMWLKKAETTLEKWESTDKYDHIIASHNGYMRLKDPVMHSREIYFDKDKKIFTIKDKIKANGKHLIEQFFHFYRKCTVENKGNSMWKIENNGHYIYLTIDKKLSSKLAHGIESPILGWESNRYDVKNKTNTIVSSCEHIGNCEFVTVIYIKGHRNSC